MLSLSKYDTVSSFDTVTLKSPIQRVSILNVFVESIWIEQDQGI